MYSCQVIDKSLVLVVQKVDITIHWINLYPLDDAASLDSTHPLDNAARLDNTHRLDNAARLDNTHPLDIHLSTL